MIIWRKTLNFPYWFFKKTVTIRRAVSKDHKASLISELCHDVSQKYTAAAGEVDVSSQFSFTQ